MHFFVWSIRNAQHNYSVETCQEFFSYEKWRYQEVEKQQC